ncbi:MAG: DNA primase, partial [Lachnospira sp.]|nr:DNA primase [Lachnospira sp.]
MYSSEVIEEVVSRNDIVDVVSGYIKLKKNGSSYSGLCPFHNEKSPSFSVSPSRQLYHCFGCGVGGNVITFVMEYENYTFLEAVRMLADRAGMSLPETDYSSEERRLKDMKTKLFEINKIAATYYYRQLRTEQGSLGLSYLKKRGLSDGTINSFGLGYSSQTSNGLYKYLKEQGYDDDLLKETGLFTYERGVHDKFWNRVMFPIMDINNKVIGFGGRVMGDAKPKYLNSP